MASTHRSIIINRSVEDVFAYFADVANDPQWRDGVKEISVRGAMGQGAQISQKLAAGPFGATVRADMDVVVYEPPTALAFQVTNGPLRPRVEFKFVPAETGTELVFSIDAPLTGLKNALMGKMAEKNMAAEAAALDNAKRLLET